MKKLLIALAMFASLSASAKQDADVLGVAFGSTCEETVQKLSKDYGTPKLRVLINLFISTRCLKVSRQTV